MYVPNSVEAHQAWPVAENFMPDFSLHSTEGQPIQTSDYHNPLNRRSLILVFVVDYSSDDIRKTSSSLLLDLARRYTEIVSGSAEVLVVVRGTTAEAAQIKQHGNLP